jgi:hypothetical protein
MARTFTGKDVHNWKVVSFSGKTMKGNDGKPLNTFDGYKAASVVARAVGGVAVRI